MDAPRAIEAAGSHGLHRRRFLGDVLGGAALGGAAVLSAPGLAVGAESPLGTAAAAQGRRVLFVWLAGGSSQFETWDPKPGRETGGPFRTIPTSVPGYSVCELMPRTAAAMGSVAVIRSLDTGFSEHELAADLVHTCRPREPALEYPEFGVILGKELAPRDSLLPGYVSIFTTSEGRRRPLTGFLGGRYAPLVLDTSLRPKNIDLPAGMTSAEHDDREQLRAALSRRFAERRSNASVLAGYGSAYEKVRGLMRSDHLFDVDREPEAVRQRYGKTAFGREALLARRLLEAGVPVVKLTRGFWDSHHDNFESHRELVPDFDRVFSVLLADLAERGLLERTLVVVLSEFGRTPKINKDVGRDHYAAAWSCALAGCGIQGGAVHGETDADGVAVKDGRVTAPDLGATIFRAIGLPKDLHYEVGLRPVPVVKEDAVPVATVLT